MSPCPFAQRAEIFPLETWPSATIDDSKLNRLHGSLSRLLGDERFDVGILEIREAGAVTEVATWAHWLHGVLLGLRERDETIAEPLTAGIADPAWDFRFGHGSFFLSLFAPLYPPTHSRWSAEGDVAFLLMQPERGFRRFGVSSRRRERRRLSEAIHRRFGRHGQSYGLSLNLESAKALRYVKPLRPEDPPIAWWEQAYDSPSDPSVGRADPG